MRPLTSPQIWISLITMTLVTAFVPPTASDELVPDACTVTEEGKTCSYKCYITHRLYIDVTGTAGVDGDTHCGGEHAECANVGTACNDQSDGMVEQTSSTGTCRLTTGTKAVCTSTPIDL